MIRIVSACAIVALSAVGAFAGAKENAIKHIAQAMAIGKLCPTLQVNFTRLSAVAYLHGVDTKADMPAIMAEAEAQMAPWAGNKDAACVAGLMLYGPKGENVPDLVSMK